MAKGESTGKKRPGNKADRKADLVTPAHGRGKIWQGAPANPVAGPGRPPSAIRQRLRGSFDERTQVLEEIADGVGTIRLAGKCEKCGHEGEPLTLDEISRAIPSASDKLRALDIMAKYGLGSAKQEIEEELMKRLATDVQAEVDDDTAQRIHERWVMTLGEYMGK